MQQGAAPAQRPRRPLNALCRDEACAHVWPVVYMPMDLVKASMLMRRAACPMCASDSPLVAPA